MKTLVDGELVSARSYYYLLDWNTSDSFKTIRLLTGKIQLNELNITEYMRLFNIATSEELLKLIKQVQIK